jgi:hypothetical protein
MTIIFIAPIISLIVITISVIIGMRMIDRKFDKLEAVAEQTILEGEEVLQSLVELTAEIRNSLERL